MNADSLLQCGFFIFITVHLALVAVWSSSGVLQTRTTIASEIVVLVGFVLLAYVSYLDHARSLRPSNLLTVYLGISLLLDIARVRTLFYQTTPTIAGIYVASFVTKAGLFALELWEKRQLLLPEWKAASLEDTSSIYNRALFVWLNALFVQGFRQVLTVDSLMEVDAEILQASRAKELIDDWDKGWSFFAG